MNRQITWTSTEDIAIALALILLALTFAINFFLTRIQQREQLRWPKLS